METNNEIRCSLCIFCFKSTDNYTNDFENEESTKIDLYRFFKVIIRHFLKYNALISADHQEWCKNACKVISETTINSDDIEPFFENVQICKSCEAITGKLSDMYHQINKLELRFDLEVSKLWSVIGCADKAVSSVVKDELESTPTFTGGGVTLGEFRNTFKQSCKVYQEIKKKFEVPSVQLTQINVEYSPLKRSMEDVDLQINSGYTPVISESFPPPEIQDHPKQPEVHNEYCRKTEVHNHKLTLTKELKVIEHDEDQQMNAKISECPVVANSEKGLSSLPRSALPLTLQEEDPLDPPNNSESTYICTTLTCSLPFTSKFELFQHNMACHIGKYFSSVQQIDMPNDQFNRFIATLLESTLDIFEKVDENYKCPFCGDQLSGRQKARNHLVVKHRPMLKEKLLELQKSDCGLSHSPQSIESTITFSNNTNNELLKSKRGKAASLKPRCLLYCSPCSQSFSNSLYMFSHDMHNHPEKYFASLKLEFLTPHQFQNCVAHMLKTTVDEFQKVGSKYKCNFCSKLISVKHYIRSHLVRMHRSVLAKKLVELQNSSNINMIMNTSRRTNKGKTLSARINKTFDNICITCGKVFRTSSLFNLHQISRHPEIFFETSNLLPSSSTENNEQFKTFVTYVLEQQIQVLTPQQGDKVKCGICSKVLSKLQCAKIHLISRHRVFLAEKLRDVQKRGLLNRKVNNEYQSVCNVCGKTYKNRYVLKSHQTIYHPAVFFENVKPIELRKDKEGDHLFHKYVRYMVEKQVDQEFVETPVVKLHQQKMDPLGKPQASLPSGEMSTIKYKCNFCLTSLRNRRIAITHIVRKHKINIAEIFEKLRGKTVKEIKLEIQSVKERQPLNLPTFNCSLCSKHFRAKFSLFQHDLSYHIDKYFSSVKLKDISNEQFKNLIGETIKNFVGNFERIGSTNKCSFCSKQFSGNQAARNHLVIKHRMIIKDKLVESQNSDTFSKNEQGFIMLNSLSLKRKRGRPKGKSRLLKTSASKFSFKFENLLLKTKGDRNKPRQKGVIDHVPIYRRQIVPKVTRCGRCGKRFANLYTLRIHLKRHCKVVRNFVEDSAKVGVELMDDFGVADIHT